MFRWLPITWLCFVFGVDRWCNGARILLSSEDGSGSHFSVLSTIGQALVDQNHQVTALISEANKEKVMDEKYAHLDFDVFPDSTIATTKEWSTWVMRHLLESRKSMLGDIMSVSPRAIYGLMKRCSELMDHALERKRQGVWYDLLVIDAHRGCSVFLTGLLETPYVFVVPSGIKPSLARRYGTPDTTAYFPEMSSGLPYQMGFWQRFMNTISATSEDLSVFFTYDVCHFLYSFKFHFTAPISGLLSGAQVILINSDFAVDFPFPLLPNAVTVGGLTTRSVKALNGEWTKLSSRPHDHGVIIFTLGTYVDSAMTVDDVKMFAEAFSSLKQTVIWQSGQDIQSIVSLSANVIVARWIPQNDLLGHPSVCLLVFHGGNNGMYEAVYHGVPMVVIPMVLDTLDVATRVVERRMGVSLDYFQLTSTRLVQAINTVIDDLSYQDNTKRASSIMRERPLLPLNRTVFWIEHVLKYGGSYLRPSSTNLYFWQMYLLDVYAVMLVMIYLAFRLLRIVLSHIWRFSKETYKNRLRHAFALVFHHIPDIRTRKQRILLFACILGTLVYILFATYTVV